MRISLLISVLLMFFTNYGFAQCGSDEVEVRIEIATDNWGNETSWRLTDFSGSLLLEGGQGGVYESFTSYADSICIGLEECIFFEIFDTYGDGIIAPNGYKIYVDEVLVASGSDDIQSYAQVSAYCPNACNMTTEALNDFQKHINGETPLQGEDLIFIRNVFNQFSECLAENESIILLAQSVVEDYDNTIGALFTTPFTTNGFSKDPANTPGREQEHAMVALQQGIFDFVFTPEKYEEYPQLIHGKIFNSCNSFPGFVEPPANPTTAKTTMIRANFKDPDGSNPYFDINNDRTAHALRPTGLYLAPGSVASVTVPQSLVGKDYYVKVGSHDWDLGIRPIFRRLDRISKNFLIDAATIEVFNPFGGAISILVPYEANEGIVEVSVKNGVECPFFSLKSFHETSDFDAEMNKPGPWAVFETDNVMYTIPKHSIVPGEYDLEQTLRDWDAAAQGINSIMARQIIPDKHNIYMIADITIRHNVYSIGYPMSNTPLNYSNVPGPAYFIDGPGGDGSEPDPNDETNFHEYGHALAMTKFPGEVEALVNVPYIMAMNHGLGQDLDIAVKNSFPPYSFEIDKTATHRMVSNSFGTERDITNSTTNEVRYQHRGYGHYFEIVNMLGWCPLRNFWKQEFIDSENGIDYGLNNQDIDLRMVRMSVAAKEDLRPLFHVFGILPQDSIALQDTFTQLGFLPSYTVYYRLQEYLDLIPEDNAAFVDYALFVYPNLYNDGPTSNPDFGVGWHYQKSLTYNTTEAQQRTDILQSIIDLYYPNGEPVNNGNSDICCILDTMVIDLVNDEVNVTGGVAPYDITTESMGSTQLVTVIDFDGCESTFEYTISGVNEEDMKDIKIYPNPTFDVVIIDLPDQDIQRSYEVSLMNLDGRLIKVMDNVQHIDVSHLSSGTYLLKVKDHESGAFIMKRIIVGM